MDITYPTKNETSTVVKDEHLSEWTVTSGVSEEIARLNLESLSAEELNSRIKPARPIETGGWWCRGVNWRNGQQMGMFFGQAKPDKEHVIDPNKKPAKYMTASGMEPDAIFLAMPDKDHWAKVYADESIIRVWTEGVKKAAAGLTLMLAVIALTGVWNWGKDGKLAPEIERWAQPGTKHVIAFDSDYRDKPSCRQAIIKFAKLLAAKGCEVLIATWTQEHKGMDDFIVANGGDAFRQAIANAQTVERWEKQFKSDEQQAKKITPRKVAKQIVESYRPSWKYQLEQNTWRNCDNGKVWRAVHDEAFTKHVYSHLEALGISYDNFSFVENVVKFLKTELLEPEWKTFDRSKWIAFNDCVYEADTGKKHKHSPGFGFFTALEHDYPKLAIDAKSSLLDQLKRHAPTFYHWAMYSQKQDPVKVLKLLAIINGVMKFRFHELQMFVYLQGVPGAGKSSFGELLESIVGKPNRYSTRITKLNDDYTIANFINSQLVICPDERKQVGEWSGLLSLTGGDTISYRQIYKPAANGKFQGTIVIISNPSVFAGDTTGIDRRLCLATFDVPIKKRDPKLKEQMQQEVPALMALALAMSDEQVTELIRGTGASAVPDFQRAAWLHKTDNDSVALFMEEMLVTANPESYVIVGNNSTGIDTLYGAYAKLCVENNSKSLFTANNFRNHLIELCRDIGWSDVRESRQRDHQYRIYGLRLRQPGDNAPSISEILGTARCAGVCIGCADGVRTLEPLENMGCAGCANENDKIIRNSIDPTSESECINVSEAPKTTHTTHTPYITGVSEVAHPTHTPCTHPHTTQEFKPGRKVDYSGEIVTVVGFEDRGRKIQIETATGKLIMVKRGSLKPVRTE